MIAMIKTLIEQGHAYAADNGDVYFAVRSDPNYGQVSGRNIDDLMVGARIEENEDKNDPLDFALWKAAKPGEPSWPSPWGAVSYTHLPNGVIRRNVATDGSVEVSSNIGVVATSDDQVKIMLSPRSSITSLQNEFKDRLQTLADVLGFDAKFEFEYPGWSYAEHSPVRDIFVESYRELFGSELRIESIHAGLECGLFAEALHGLDAIAVGPTLSDVHTPDESMELASAERFYELLIDVLKRLAA